MPPSLSSLRLLQRLALSQILASPSLITVMYVCKYTYKCKLYIPMCTHTHTQPVYDFRVNHLVLDKQLGTGAYVLEVLGQP